MLISIAIIIAALLIEHGITKAIDRQTRALNRIADELQRSEPKGERESNVAGRNF